MALRGFGAHAVHVIAVRSQSSPFRREPKGMPGLIIVSANSTGGVMSELGANRVPKIDWWELLISALLVGAISAVALILVH